MKRLLAITIVLSTIYQPAAAETWRKAESPTGTDRAKIICTARADAAVEEAKLHIQILDRWWRTPAIRASAMKSCMAEHGFTAN